MEGPPNRNHDVCTIVERWSVPIEFKNIEKIKINFFQKQGSLDKGRWLFREIQIWKRVSKGRVSILNYHGYYYRRVCE